MSIIQVEPGEIRKGHNSPAVVFGQRNKLTAEGPFLDLLFAFRQELERAGRLTVIGYSFRDPHVNEYLAQWINASPEHRFRIVDPGFQNSKESFAGALQRHCQARLEVISEKAEAVLGALFPAA